MRLKNQKQKRDAKNERRSAINHWKDNVGGVIRRGSRKRALRKWKMRRESGSDSSAGRGDQAMFEEQIWGLENRLICWYC